MNTTPNTYYEDLYNKLTYYYTTFNNSVEPTIKPGNSDIQPIWTTGMFRSGTSITTQLMAHLGFDLGPNQDLLRPIGERKFLNPQGFFENYLLMDFSLYIFNQLNSWGDNPPPISQVNEINLNKVNYKNFVFNSIVNIHDDRISNGNKARILKQFYPGNLDTYLRQKFNTKFTIKNPHFCLLYPLLDKYFPNGKYLVVFRNPIALIDSAKNVTPNASFNLFKDYYSNIINHHSAIFFDYDNLIQNPKQSLSLLANELKVPLSDFSILKILNRKGSKVTTNEIPKGIKPLYDQLKVKAINKQ